MQHTQEATTLSSMVVHWRHQRDKCNRLEADLTRERGKLRDLEEMLAEQLALEGYSSVTHDGDTIYRRTLRSVAKATGVTAEEVIAALHGTDLEYLVGESYNAASLKSAVLERLDHGEELPAVLAPLLNVTEWQTIGCRRSK